MKVSRVQAADNRDRVIDVAAKLFREKGFDGIGVVDLMKGAGLTHGGFYSQFASKEDLAAQSCARAIARTAERWNGLLKDGTEDPLKNVIAAYLSPRHRDNPGNGCAFAALGAEAPRHEPAVRKAFTTGLQSLIDALSRMLPKGAKEARRKKALATMSTLVGALVLARAVDDPELSNEVLEAVKASL